MVKVFSRPPDHHIEISGGPTEVLVDWGHRTTLISSPAAHSQFLARPPYLALCPIPSLVPPFLSLHLTSFFPQSRSSSLSCPLSHSLPSPLPFSPFISHLSSLNLARPPYPALCRIPSPCPSLSFPSSHVFLPSISLVLPILPFVAFPPLVPPFLSLHLTSFSPQSPLCTSLIIQNSQISRVQLTMLALL